MQILASLISLLALALALGMIGWTVRTHGPQIVAALLGRSPVALDGVTCSGKAASPPALDRARAPFLDSVTILKPGQSIAPIQRRPSALPAPIWEPIPLAA